MNLQARYVETKDFFIEEYTLKKPMSEMHYHNSYELYYILKGERDYFIGDRFFKAYENDFVLVRKNVFHRTAGKGATRILIFFTDEMLRRYFSKEIVARLLTCFDLYMLRPTPEENEYIAPLLNRLLAEYNRSKKNGEKQDECLIACYLFELLFKLLSGQNFSVPQNTSDERVSKIIEYINENYFTIENIDEIAGHFFISKYYLYRIFKEMLGVSLISYLNMIKVRGACAMLKAGKCKMVDVAMKCGFNSSAYFCKVFKKEMNMSPKEYRNRCG